MITVIGIPRTQKMLGRYITWANLTMPKLTEEAADEGAQLARQIAPKKTGALIQAINVTPGASKNDWRVVSRTPKNQTDVYGKPTKRRVPYQLYLHLGLRGFWIGRSTGDHRYMFTTGAYLSRKYPEMIKKSLDRIKKTQ